MECSICLAHISSRSTRSTKKLPCNHIFHSKCIHSWETNGGYTCPLCRAPCIDLKYRMTIHIENLHTHQVHMSNIIQTDTTIQNIVDQIGENDFSSASLTFADNTLSELHALLNELGVLF